MAALVVRGQGFKDGGEDVRDFRSACLGGGVVPEVSLLLRGAMAEARTLTDPAGNSKLAKSTEGGRRRRARDDATAGGGARGGGGLAAKLADRSAGGCHGSTSPGDG